MTEFGIVPISVAAAVAGLTLYVRIRAALATPCGTVDRYRSPVTGRVSIPITVSLLVARPLIRSLLAWPGDDESNCTRVVAPVMPATRSALAGAAPTPSTTSRRHRVTQGRVIALSSNQREPRRSGPALCLRAQTTPQRRSTCTVLGPNGSSTVR